MNNVQKNWFPVCYSKEVRKKTMSIQLFGTPIVLFRDSKGTVQALYDRCPHRGAPLSKGSVEKDAISCPYHGWAFSGSGSCLAIPGMGCMKEKSVYRVQNYSVLEQYGLIWVNLNADANIDSIPHFSELCDENYSSFSLSSTVNVGALEVIENVLDPMHTHFVHKGWIRSNKEMQAQTVVLTTKENSVEACYLNEQPQQGIIYKILTLGRRVNKSWGRFLYPNVIQLEYKSNKDDHLLITGFCSPISDDKTRIFLFSSCRTKLPLFLIQRLMKYLFKVALKQDQKILNLLGKHKKKYPQGKKEVSTYVDLVGPHVERLLSGHILPEKTKEIIIYV